MRNYKTDVTSKEDVHYNINTPQKEAVLQKNLKAANDIKILKRVYDVYLHPVREDEKTPCGDGNVTRKRDNGSHSIPIADQQNIVHTARYRGPSALTPITISVPGKYRIHGSNGPSCLEIDRQFDE